MITKEKGLGGLKLLDFPVEEQNLFMGDGERLTSHMGIVRPDTKKLLGIVRSRYQLVSHREALDPMISKLGEKGWDVHMVSTERDGARAFVELINRHEMETVQKGDHVGMRLTLWNSYDGSTAIRSEIGSFRLVCLNGMVQPSHTMKKSSIRHLSTAFDRIEEISTVYHQKFQEMLNVYRGMSDHMVSPEIAAAVLKEVVGTRKLAIVHGYWLRGTGADGKPTAWNLYNGITQYLTHDFKGSTEARDFKSRIALDRILQLGHN